MAFLGHVVSSEGIMVDPKKIEAIQQWQGRISMIEICSFFELVEYYYQFVKDFSKIVALLTRLT